MKSLTKLMLASALMMGCGSSASIIPFADAGEPFSFDSGSPDTGSDADSGIVIVLPGTDAGSSTGNDSGNSDTGSSTSSDTGSTSTSDSGLSTSSDSGTTVSSDAGSDAGTDAGVDSGHSTVPDAGVDSGHSEDAGVDSGRHTEPDAGDCQEQFNCCLQGCDNDDGEHCDRDHCRDQCREQFEQCLGQGGCQH